MFINNQCAVIFLIEPAKYAPAYQLLGIPGEIAIQGFGVLFLMWNVPYAIALIHPFKHRISLYEAVLMQFVGLIGETLILLRMPPGYPTLQASISRFVIFDGLGFIALLLAAWITIKRQNT
jgi:hypothetical protein